MAKMEAMLADVRKDTEWNSSKLCGSIAPMVQCLATEQIELRNQVGQLTTEAATAAAETKCSLKDAEVLERELQQECAMQTACDLDLSSTMNVEELKEEVCQLSQKSTSQADCTKLVKSA